MFRRFCECCGYIMEKCNDVLEVFTNILIVVIVSGTLGLLGFMVVYTASGLLLFPFANIEWVQIMRNVLCYIGAIISIVGISYNEIKKYNKNCEIRRNDCK